MRRPLSLPLRPASVAAAALCAALAAGASAAADLGDLLFPNPQVPVGNGPVGIDAGDLDGDGDPDLVVALAGSTNPSTGLHDGTTVAVLLVGDDGLPGPPLLLPSGTGPQDVVVGDFDGDGDLDVVSSDAESRVVTLHRNLGGAAAFAPESFDAGLDPFDLEAADLDGDGDLDLAVTQLGNVLAPVIEELLLLANDGTGAFVTLATLPAGSAGTSVEAADLDGDGDVDLAATSFDEGTVGVYRGDGAGGFTPVQTLDALASPFGGPFAVEAGDLDGDGVPELAVSVAETFAGPGRLVVFGGLGDGTFAPGVSHEVGRDARDLHVVDVDDDGDLDVVVASQDDSFASVFGNDGDGGLLAATVEVGLGPTGVLVVDVDGDGARDLVTANTAGDDVSVVRGLGGGAFGSEVGVHVPIGVRSADVVDVDGDGVADAVVAGDTRELAVLRGAPEGTFGPPEVTELASLVRDMATGDVDGDGDVDVVILGSDLELRRNAGDGTFDTSERIDLALEGAQALSAGDVDGDGDLDLLVTQVRTGFLESTTQVVPLLGDGAGGFVEGAGVPFDAGGAIPAFTGSTPTRSAAADLDGDGLDDLVVVPFDELSTFPDDRAVVLLADGAGGLGAAVLHPLPPGSRNPTVADVDGDGVLDVVVAVQLAGGSAFGGSTVAVLRGLGGGALAPFVEVEAGVAPRHAAVGDLDGDGRADLAVLGSLGTLTVLAGDGAGGFERDHAYGSNWQGVASFVRDLDGDGAPDVVSVAGFSKQVNVLLSQRGGVALPYGCASPAGSLVVLAGAPTLGAELVLGVDDPSGTKTSGSLALLALTAAPDPAFPCGAPAPGLGMAGPAAPGELLVDLASPTLVVTGPPWAGPGAPAPLALGVPADPALAGLSLFAQGALVDATAADVGLTGGLELVLD